MKIFFTFSFVCLFSVLLIQCSPKTSKKIAKKESTPVEERVTEPSKSILSVAPETTQPVDPVSSDENTDEQKRTALTQGKMTWGTACKSCHELHHPNKFTMKEWDKILADMIPKAKLSKEESVDLKIFFAEYAKK